MRWLFRLVPVKVLAYATCSSAYQLRTTQMERLSWYISANCPTSVVVFARASWSNILINYHQSNGPPLASACASVLTLEFEENGGRNLFLQRRGARRFENSAQATDQRMVIINMHSHEMYINARARKPLFRT